MSEFTYCGVAFPSSDKDKREKFYVNQDHKTKLEEDEVVSQLYKWLQDKSGYMLMTERVELEQPFVKQASVFYDFVMT